MRIRWTDKSAAVAVVAAAEVDTILCEGMTLDCEDTTRMLANQSDEPAEKDLLEPHWQLCKVKTLPSLEMKGCHTWAIRLPD